LSLKRFKKINTEDRERDQLQENVDQFLEQILRREIIPGILLESISLTTGTPNEISHKLGRKLIGWNVTRMRSQATVWDNQDTNTRKDRTLILNVSANVTVDLWIF